MRGGPSPSFSGPRPPVSPDGSPGGRAHPEDGPRPGGASSERRFPAIPIDTSPYRVNHQIRIREVRLIDQDGGQVGVVPIEEARRLADEAGLDLVEVSPNARPPVCKIIDYGKFKYQQKKNQQRSRTHQSQLKEVRVRPKMSPHDLEYRLEKARQFLLEGDKVQVNCLFRGREMTHLEIGDALLRRVAGLLADVSRVERGSKLEGRRMSLLLTPKASAQKPHASSAPRAASSS